MDQGRWGLGCGSLVIGLREIAIDLRLCRNHVVLESIGLGDGRVFGGDEKEQLIPVPIEATRPIDWAANRTANGVVAVAWTGLSVAEFIEIAVGVQILIAEIVVKSPMELLRAALGDEIKVSASSLPILCLVIRAHKGDLLNGVEIQRRIQRVETACVAGDAVDRGEIVFAIDAIDCRRSGSPQAT